MPVGLAGVEHDQAPAAEPQRHRGDAERAEVDAQSGVGRAVERGEGVEQARVSANPVVLHARAQAGELGSIHDLGLAAAITAASTTTPITVTTTPTPTPTTITTATPVTMTPAATEAAGCAPEIDKRKAQRDRERRGGGEAGTERQVPTDLQASADERDAGAGELGDDAPHERTPAGRGRGLRQRKLVTLVQVARVGVHEPLAGRASQAQPRRARSRPRRSRTAGPAQGCSRCARRSG